MVDKVKCGNKECKNFDIAIPVSNLYINRTAPLNGPWPCQVCREDMKIAVVIPDSYKRGGTKHMTSKPITQPISQKKVRTKKVKFRKLTVKGATLGGIKQVKKSTRKKSPARKRISGK